MQRYRINYHWLIGVFVGSLVLAIVAFFLHRWQVERKAGMFLAKAEAALVEEDSREAFDQFRKYVSLRPKEEEARVKMANAALAIINGGEASREEVSRAFSAIDQTVRKTDDFQLRRELAELMMKFQRPQDALVHVEDLLAITPGDSQLNAMRVRALFQAKSYQKAKAIAFGLIGYDKKSDELVAEQASLEGEPDVYALLADVLLRQDKNPELARRVIEQMVEANPDSAQAHLQKSVFLAGRKEKEGAAESLDRAYALDPKDAAILMQKSQAAFIDSLPQNSAEEQQLSEAEKAQLEEDRQAKAQEAKAYIARGIEEHPDNFLFYRLMAQVEQRLERYEEAIQILDQGIDHLDKMRSVDLVLDKMDLLLREENYEALQQEIQRLTKLNRPDLQPIIDFQKARILFQQQKWAAAGRELKRVRPLLFAQPKFQVLAGTMLGACYERQGMADLALQSYGMVLDDFPEHAPALAGRQRMRKQLNPEEGGMELDRVVNQILELPPEKQDWQQVDALVEQVIEQRRLSPARALLIRSRILMKRERYQEAQALLEQAAAADPEDVDVQFAVLDIYASDPQQGPEAALEMLDRLEEKEGVTLRSLAHRADLIYRLRPEDAAEQLQALLTASDDLTEVEILQLNKILALKFEQLGKNDEARVCYEKVVEQDPGNLPIRMQLFEIALREQDDAAMQKAQAGILEVVKSKNDASYLLTEVKRQIIAFGRQEISKEELAKARPLLDKALTQRPKWHELHIAYGQLLLVLGQEIELALEHFDQALDSGPVKANAVSVQVRLLHQRGLFAQARERMERLRPEQRMPLLGRLEAEVLVKTGDAEAGFEAAEKLAQSQPLVPATQFWFSRIAQGAGKLEVAATALQSALQIDPSSPDNWLRLVGLHVEQKDASAARETVRAAHLRSDEEFLPLLTGKYNELLSRWQMAERIYLAAFADRLETLEVAHRMADFYLLWTKRDAANLGKASIYINRILRAANEGEAEAGNVHVVWARQKAAQILMQDRDYQRSLQAEQLLRQSAAGSQLAGAEAELLVDILVSRNDPGSLLEAKRLLAGLRSQGALPKKGALQLAQLLSRTGEWEKAKDLLLDMLSQYGTDPAVQATYIAMLIDHSEYSSAEGRIKRLGEIDSSSASLLPLSARLASERGDQAGLTRLLRARVPNLKGALSAEQLQGVLGIARLAQQYGAYELAEELFRSYVKRLPAQELELAKYLALHGDCEEAVAIMKRQFEDHMDEVIQLGTQMIATRRTEIGEQYNEPIDQLIRRSLRDDPDSVTRKIVRAEAYDAQGKYEESIQAYDSILKRGDVPTRTRAAVMNNLGFQLGLLNQRVDEAEQLINEAMDTFGPVADMLDTRAVVRMALGKYDLAIEDMQLALSVSKDPVKLYHLAKAYALAGQGEAAREAWEQAQALGFEEASLLDLEKATFEEVRQQIESL